MHPDLKDFQREDIARMQAILQDHRAVFDLSDAGTGKSAKVIGLADLRSAGNVLIVAPNIALLNWVRQLRLWSR